MTTKIKRTKNKFETRIQLQLKRSKLPFKYESEKFAYVLARHYIPDFVVITPTGKLYIELKGYLRPEHKAKMVAVKRQHPEIDLRILFYAPNPKNIKWAEKHGFRWASGSIPKEWLDGL